MQCWSMPVTRVQPSNTLAVTSVDSELGLTADSQPVLNTWLVTVVLPSSRFGASATAVTSMDRTAAALVAWPSLTA